MENINLYDYLLKLQAITKIGLLYSKDPYAISNYAQIEKLTKQMLDNINDVKTSGNNYFTRDIYPTPNISVRTIIRNENKEFLMVQERNDGGFSLPGGWCDLYESPATAAQKEVLEETGFDVKITRLVGIFNRTPFKNRVSVPEYVVIFAGDIIAKVSNHDHEITSVKWVNESNLSPLSAKVTQHELQKFLDAEKQLNAVFE